MGISGKTADTGQSILVVGADGVVGRSLVRALEQEGRNVLGSTRRHSQMSRNRFFIDLATHGSHQNLPAERISTAILCAAATSISHCQQDPVGTHHINVKSTVALARRLVDCGVHVIFLSSNTVFNGEAAYAKATDPTTPQTEYGRQKAEAEKELLDLDGQVAVVRFSKIVSPDMLLLIGWVNDLSMGRIIHPFSDGVMAPVSCVFAVDLLRRVMDKRLSGIIQASASEDISYEQAARYLAAKLGAECSLIKPISYAQVGISVFPKNTTLDTSRLQELGLQVSPANYALDQIRLSKQVDVAP